MSDAPTLPPEPLAELLADLTRDGRPSLAWATERMPDGTIRRAWDACASGPAMAALLTNERASFAWRAGRRPRVVMKGGDVPVYGACGSIVGYVHRPPSSEFWLGDYLGVVDGMPVEWHLRGDDVPAWILDLANEWWRCFDPALRDCAWNSPRLGARILRAAVEGVPTLRIAEGTERRVS